MSHPNDAGGSARSPAYKKGPAQSSNGSVVQDTSSTATTTRQSARPTQRPLAPQPPTTTGVEFGGFLALPVAWWAVAAPPRSI